MATPNSVIQLIQKVQNSSTPYSQSTSPSKPHTSPTATPLAPNFWTNKIQNCLHVLQRNYRLRPLVSFWTHFTFTVLPAVPALHPADTRMLQLQRRNRRTHGFRTFSPFGPNVWNNLRQNMMHSAALYLQKQTRDLSLLRIFQLCNTAGGKKKRKREKIIKSKPVSKRIL